MMGLWTWEAGTGGGEVMLPGDDGVEAVTKGVVVGAGARDAEVVLGEGDVGVSIVDDDVDVAVDGEGGSVGEGDPVIL